MKEKERKRERKKVKRKKEKRKKKERKEERKRRKKIVLNIFLLAYLHAPSDREETVADRGRVAGCSHLRRHYAPWATPRYYV
jgi:hypothetical protein